MMQEKAPGYCFLVIIWRDAEKQLPGDLKEHIGKVVKNPKYLFTLYGSEAKMRERKCENCVFFGPGDSRAEQNPDGRCRRYTPKVFAVTHNTCPDILSSQTKWPLVKPNDWCGEFEAKCDHEWVNADFEGADLCHKCKTVRTE